MSTAPKQALLAQFAAVARALGHPHRLELVEQIAQRECGVEALAERVGLSVANASQHLQQLRRAGLVTSRRDGRSVRYRLADPAALEVLAGLRRLAERNVAEVDRIVAGYFRNLDDMEPVSRSELLERAQEGRVTVLDVRPPDEYQAGHLPNAVNIPLHELGERLAELDPAHEVVAYCRGAYCVLSFEAVASLRARGFQARRLEDGMPEWQAAGLPVEAGAGEAA